MPAAFSWSLFEQVPVVGILRNIAAAQVERIAEIYCEEGFTTLEITMNSPGAAALISNLSERYSGRLNIGAGTVCTMEELDEAVIAGANFIVTPVISEEVIQSAVRRSIPIFPGAFTPSEIYHAWKLGASMVKVFPATMLGPEYIRDVLAPLPYLKLLPTGGVNADNVAKFLKAGAAGVGVGSTLFPKEMISNGEWQELRGMMRGFREEGVRL